MAKPLFHVVLHEPEIPNNTGNIGRTCVATGCALHLIRPLGFSTSVKALRRAGLDYWPRLSPTEHDGWAAFLADRRPASLWLFTTRATRPVWEADLKPGDYLVFGKESKGLPEAILDAHPDSLAGLPMLPAARSLNLATAVCAVVYEGIRQQCAAGRLLVDPTGRLRPAPAGPGGPYSVNDVP